MNDTPLFDFMPPRTRPAFAQAHRRTDPVTSKIADQKMKESGKDLAHAEKIVQYLVTHVWSEDTAMTFSEIAVAIGLEHNQVHKRMSGIRSENPWSMCGGAWTIQVGPDRKCRRRGGLCHTYYAEDKFGERTLKPPKYKPGEELMYLGQVRVRVTYWVDDVGEYLCHCPTWGEDVWCQEKDLKPITEDK